jgi:Zn-finger nucleic acid-binding protein
MNDNYGNDYGANTRALGGVPSRVRAKEVPSMNCPIDGTPLQMADRQGIEIDYCPTCRGVWLDRGELDKIIERSATQMPAASAPSPGGHTTPPADPYRRYDDDDDYGRYDRDYDRKRKRRSFLDDLFDFD